MNNKISNICVRVFFIMHTGILLYINYLWNMEVLMNKFKVIII